MNLEVIIPVGPGHQELYLRAVESVRIATLNKGPFAKVNIRIIDDTDGNLGRSAARNQGLEQCLAKWVFFLDADDLMHPDCLKNFKPGYDAVFGQIMEYDKGLATWRYQVPEIKDFKTLLAFDPFLTLQMGHFVRREVAIKIGFDVEMNTGEDWKYYLSLWKDYKCIKIDKPLFINDRSNHSIGPKAANGVEWREVVSKLIETAHES